MNFPICLGVTNFFDLTIILTFHIIICYPEFPAPMDSQADFHSELIAWAQVLFAASPNNPFSSNH